MRMYPDQVARQKRQKGHIYTYLCRSGGGQGVITYPPLGQGGFGVVCVTEDSTLYVVDYEWRLLKVSPQGDVTHFAGKEGGTGADDVQATEAAIGRVPQCAVDGAGNVYLVDQDSRRVRKIDTTGIITTFLETELPSGVAADAEGNVYIADMSLHQLVKVDTKRRVTILAGAKNTPGSSGDGGPAKDARLVGPTFLALDRKANKIYMTEYVTPHVRVVDLTKETIDSLHDVANLGKYVMDVAVDAQGNAYVAVNKPDGVWRIPSTGTGPRPVTAVGDGTTGDGGPAIQGHLAKSPLTLASTSSSDLFISDLIQPAVRLVSGADTNAPLVGLESAQALPPSIPAGQPRKVTFGWKMANPFPVVEKAVTVTAALPAGATYESSSPAGATCTNDLVTWPTTDVAANSSATYDVTASVTRKTTDTAATVKVNATPAGIAPAATEVSTHVA
ncbi:hypothetical protein AADR41_11095 [Streptomyces sp. CLV115]|uniref:hypothetical protein n=1 Tax=Streptomyces sp. CLV115 TaxID=3138502 RepID=UPI00313C7B5C